MTVLAASRDRPVDPGIIAAIADVVSAARGADIDHFLGGSYRESRGLMASARFVLTDSGGIQEETSVFHSPGRGIPRSLQIRLTTGVRISR